MKNPGSGIAMTKLRNGHVLLVLAAQDQAAGEHGEEREAEQPPQVPPPQRELLDPHPLHPRLGKLRRERLGQQDRLV